MDLAAAALARDHPGVAAQAAWLDEHRSRLLARCRRRDDLAGSVSSGCAASGARTHAQVLADDALHALGRLDAGTFSRCERCGDLLPLERLEAAPSATTCTGCARPDAFDARWCR